MSRLRSRLTYANVVATLALFIAVATGGAYAANTVGSADIIDESLLSQDIKNGEVKTSDLAADAVTSSKLANGSIQNSDLGPDAVTTSKIKAGNVGSSDIAANAILSGQIADGNVFTSDLAVNAVTSARINDGSVLNADLAPNAVTGGKVADNSLDGSDINEAGLNLGGFFAAAETFGGCTADDHAINTCAATDITLERPGRLLLVATGEWHTFNLDDAVGAGSDTDDPTLVLGNCQLFVDGAPVSPPQALGERQQAGVASNHPFGGTMALTGISDAVGAGAHQATVGCTEVDGDLDWGGINLTAARVDDDGVSGIAGRTRDSRDPGKQPLASPSR